MAQAAGTRVPGSCDEIQPNVFHSLIMTFQGPSRVFLGVVLALSASSYGQNDPPPPKSQEMTAASGEYIEVGFDLHPKFAAILVKVEINKTPAVLILDTGSSRTILDSRIVDLDPRELRRPANVGRGSGISGDDARWGKATLQVGTRLFRDHRVVVSDMRDVSRNFQQQIDGLLGQDIVCEFGLVVIDFNKRKITFAARPKSR